MKRQNLSIDVFYEISTHLSYYSLINFMNVYNLNDIEKFERLKKDKFWQLRQKARVLLWNMIIKYKFSIEYTIMNRFKCGYYYWDYPWNNNRCKDHNDNIVSNYDLYDAMMPEDSKINTIYISDQYNAEDQNLLDRLESAGLIKRDPSGKYKSDDFVEAVMKLID